DVFSYSGGARFLERKLTVWRSLLLCFGAAITVGYTGVTQSDSYGLVDVFANYKFTEKRRSDFEGQ
ncbi:hypothetical protein JS562_52650, partial [Agrobacterium sp. S2]|nr:hypothetical protein [Agrobacterium sp. S2]